MSKRLPLVSILTPTFNRRAFIGQYLRYIRQQDYRGPLEVLIADDGDDPIEDLLRGYTQIRYLRMSDRQPLGYKRNLLATEARGEVMVHMDDDDFYPSNRVSHAVDRLLASDRLIAGSSEHYFYVPHEDRVVVSGPFHDNHAVASTMAYRRAYLADHRFVDADLAQEEPAFTDNFSAAMVQLDPRSTILGIVHARNTWDKRGSAMRPTAFKLKDFVRDQDDRRFYRRRVSQLQAGTGASPLPA